MARKKLLVVDDEPYALIILAKTLSARGYEVITAGNGNIALELAKTCLPDLIILDILMPNVDGTQVASELRENPATKDIPVIFLTCLITRSTQETGERYHDTGQYVFMAKPYDLNSLLKEIERLIGTRVC